MNESSLVQLKIIVERAIRPVQASIARKRRMREELLAHVSGVFEEEFARLDNERSALEWTALRLGEPNDITTHLQESVPAGDGIARFFEGRPNESMTWGVLRFVLGLGVVCLVIFGAALFAAGWDRVWSLEELKTVTSNLTFLPVVLVGIALMMYWMENSIRGAQHLTAAPRLGWVKAIASAWATPGVRHVMISVGSCQFLLFMSIYASANWPTQSMDWNHLASLLGTVPAMAFKAVLCVFAGLVFAWPAVERRRHHEEWTGLPIDNRNGAAA
jgi:hypothetical protein